ncbi:MAG: hypothetical protein ACKVKO_03640 [Acidimicrobiales bacterium]
MAIKLVVAASPDREGTQNQIECFADGIRLPIGPEVAVSFLVFAPNHHGTRPVVGCGYRQKGVTLIVAETDVEAGLMTLNERVLKN